MNSIINAGVLWFVVGFVLFILEFLIPGLVIFFFAIGAWAVAVVSLFLDISVNTQLSIFLVTSILSVLLFRKALQKRMSVRKAFREVQNDEFIGHTATAETEIAPGKDGKVSYKGVSWTAITNDIIQPGQEVIITGNESIRLKVKIK